MDFVVLQFSALISPRRTSSYISFLCQYRWVPSGFLGSTSILSPLVAARYSRTLLMTNSTWKNASSEFGFCCFTLLHDVLGLCRSHTPLTVDVSHTKKRRSGVWHGFLNIAAAVPSHRVALCIMLQVGARVTGRVLTVDAGSSKATLTLKKSMVKDKRAPITSYQEVRHDILPFIVHAIRDAEPSTPFGNCCTHAHGRGWGGSTSI